MKKNETKIKMPFNIQLFAEEDGGAVTQTGGKTEGANDNNAQNEKNEKTFTQEEVNSLLAKERKKMPNKDELKEFNEWKDSKKTDAEKQTELTQKLSDTANENTSLKQENQVLKSGVNVDDVDYVLFKVSKMEGEFEDNLEDFLKNNPKYLKNKNVADTDDEDTGVSVTKNKEKAESGVTAILKAKHPELFK